MSTPSSPAEKGHYAKIKLMAAVTVGMALFMVGIKTYLYLLTDAVSFLAVMLDSLMDVGLSVATLVGVYWASKPADRRHRFGYGKMEALVALLQAIFLSLASLTLCWEAGHRLMEPHVLNAGMFEILATAFIFIANLALVAMQNRVVTETGSLAISGDKAHYTSDLFTNGGVLFILAVNHVAPAAWMDPALTLVIAFYLLFSAFTVGQGAANMLLDREAPEELREEMFVAASMVEGVAGVHDLRVIDRGTWMSASLDIELDGDINLMAAHDIAKHVESALLAIVPNAEIMIHMDPVGDREDSRHKILRPLHFT